MLLYISIKQKNYLSTVSTEKSVQTSKSNSRKKVQFKPFLTTMLLLLYRVKTFETFHSVRFTKRYPPQVLLSLKWKLSIRKKVEASGQISCSIYTKWALVQPLTTSYPYSNFTWQNMTNVRLSHREMHLIGESLRYFLNSNKPKVQKEEKRQMNYTLLPDSNSFCLLVTNKSKVICLRREKVLKWFKENKINLKTFCLSCHSCEFVIVLQG